MLNTIAAKDERLVIGLMSGTSADGIDAALVGIQGQGADSSFSLMASDTLRFSPGVRARILQCQGARAGDAGEITLLNAYLGELFAHAALHVCKKGGVNPLSVDLIGSHGQTLYHMPTSLAMPGFSVRGTLQVGSPAIIAERTGITVVSDFRSRDMAAGGQGAPLVAYLDYALYRHHARSRIALNIGGIANLTAIPADAKLSQVTAFDTGPGNSLMDAAVIHFTQGAQGLDRNGTMAASGTADPALLARLLEHPFLKKAPPKSAEKGEFGPAFLKAALQDFPSLRPADVLATLAAFTVQTITTAILEHCLQDVRYEEIIVSGGGAENPVLMSGLRRVLPKLAVTTADDYSIPNKAKEAVLMAFLANETVRGRAGNVPSATGAQRPVVLGSITPGIQAWDHEL
jgi:anhydro-N-acetylmuramic acid kinase